MSTFVVRTLLFPSTDTSSSFWHASGKDVTGFIVAAYRPTIGNQVLRNSKNTEQRPIPCAEAVLSGHSQVPRNFYSSCLADKAFSCCSRGHIATQHIAEVWRRLPIEQLQLCRCYYMIRKSADHLLHESTRRSTAAKRGIKLWKVHSRLSSTVNGNCFPKCLLADAHWGIVINNKRIAPTRQLTIPVLNLNSWSSSYDFL